MPIALDTYERVPSLAVDFDSASEAYDFGNLARVPTGDTDFTIEAWVFFTALTGWKEYMGKVGSGPFNGWYTFSTSTGGTDMALVFDDARVASLGLTQAANEWTYHCWSHNASANTVQGYYAQGLGRLIVGTLTSAIAGPTATTSALQIGSQAAFPTDGGIVRLAFVRIWNAALSETQIRRIWNKRFIPKYSPHRDLAFLWDANLDAGPAALDWMSGTVATLINSPTRYFQGPPLDWITSEVDWLTAALAAGASVSIVASARAAVYASASVIAQRALIAVERAASRPSAAIVATRAISASSRAAARSSAASPSTRALSAQSLSMTRAYIAALDIATTRALIATAIVSSRASAVTPIARALSAIDRAQISASASVLAQRAIVASSRAASRASAAAPIGRLLVGTGIARSRASASVIATRAIVAIERSQSRPSAAIVRTVALVATERTATRGEAYTGAGFILLFATARASSRMSSALPVERAIVATERASDRAASALPISRALSAIAVARSVSTASAVRLVAIAAAARSLGMSSAVLPILRQLAAQSVAISRASVIVRLSAPLQTIPQGRAVYRPAIEQVSYRPDAEHTCYRPAIEQASYRPDAEGDI